MKTINIREVAKIAGVSPSTVSRVINGSAKVSPEKTAKVLQDPAVVKAYLGD